MDVRGEIKKGAVRPVKSLGQNFLTDELVAGRIVEAAELTKEDVVIEVGPGLGALTALICEKAGQVIAVEIDRHLIPRISANMAEHGNFELIHDDILKIPFDELYRRVAQTGCKRVKVLSNLPYYITTAVMMRFFEESPQPDKMVFMMQREVADRLVAKPSTKAYGSLTVLTNYYAQPHRAFYVAPHCFVPQPDVESAVVVLDIRDVPPVPVPDKTFFFGVVRAAFAQRRKTLVNCLISAGLIPKDRVFAEELFAKAGIDVRARGESLTMSEFATLTDLLYFNIPNRNQD